jgi:hypothetical protein
MTGMMATLGWRSRELLFCAKEGEFRKLEKHDAARAEPRDLTTQLCADPAAHVGHKYGHAGHKYGLAIEETVQSGVIQLHPVATEQVAEFDGSQRGDTPLAGKRCSEGSVITASPAFVHSSTARFARRG